MTDLITAKPIAERPVFVCDHGRRRRLMRAGGITCATLITLWLAAVVLGALGDPLPGLSVVPLQPSILKPPAPAHAFVARKVEPRPAPAPVAIAAATPTATVRTPAPAPAVKNTTPAVASTPRISHHTSTRVKRHSGNAWISHTRGGVTVPVASHQHKRAHKARRITV